MRIEAIRLSSAVKIGTRREEGLDRKQDRAGDKDGFGGHADVTWSKVLNSGYGLCIPF